MTPARSLYATLLTRMSRSASMVRGLVVFAFALVEVPVFLLRHRAIFANGLVLPFWHWSFGHTVAAIDYASRLYYPHRISVVYIPHPGSNEYVPLCFEHNVDTFVFRALLSPSPGQVDRGRYGVLRAWLLVLSALTTRVDVIERHVVYQSLSLARGRLLTPGEDGGLAPADDWTGYLRLLHGNIGPNPSLRQSELQACEQAIEAAIPGFSERPFATVLLRRKDEEGPSHTSFRNSGPASNYRRAVEHLVERGFNVVGTGETDAAAFADIPGFYGLDSVDVPAKLLNVYLLSECALFIGAQSGGHVLPNACDKLCLLCDAMPYRLGTFRERDLVLFKPLRHSASGRALSLTDVFRNRPNIAYGNQLDEGVELDYCSESDLLEATREAAEAVLGSPALTEADRVLVERFHALVPVEMTLSHQRNRPPIHVLRRERAELLSPAADPNRNAGVAASPESTV